MKIWQGYHNWEYDKPFIQSHKRRYDWATYIIMKKNIYKMRIETLVHKLKYNQNQRVEGEKGTLALQKW